MAGSLEVYNRRRGEEVTLGFALVTKGAETFETGASFVSGDTQVSKDGGSFANATNDPTHVGNGIYELTLTAEEMDAERIYVTIIDQDGPVWNDHALLIETENTQPRVTVETILARARKLLRAELAQGSSQGPGL